MKSAWMAAVVAAGVLLTGLAPVEASHFVVVQKAHLNTPASGVDSVDFKDQGKTVRFWSSFRGDQHHIMATSKPNWMLHFDTYWEFSETRPNTKLPIGFIIEQYKDTDTDRIFYSVADVWYEGTHREFLLGFDDNRKSMIAYFDTGKMDIPEGSGGIFERNGNLFMGLDSDGGNVALRPVYKLDWSEKDKWFGYEYIENPRKAGLM